ncbi:hypothetical protein CDAR_568081, partial [Caerostris darwini]
MTELMEIASAEGAGPFQGPPRPEPVDLSTDDELTQRQIFCDGIRQSTANLKKANEDIAMTEHFRMKLGSNSDVILDDLLAKKVQDLTSQRNGLEEQVRHYGVCPIIDCMFHHPKRKAKTKSNEFVFPAKRHTSTVSYRPNEVSTENTTSPSTSNRFQNLNSEENLNEQSTPIITPRIPPIMIRQKDNLKLQLKTIHATLKPEIKTIIS